jgi:hypothetical protein
MVTLMVLIMIDRDILVNEYNTNNLNITDINCDGYHSTPAIFVHVNNISLQ